MGSTKPEKKVKKIKKRSRELVENGESAGGASPLESADKYSFIKKDQDDVASTDPKAYKRKKARKNKSKDNSLSIESTLVANDEQEIKADANDSVKSKQDKRKKDRKNKSKDNSLSIESTLVANDEQEIKPDANDFVKSKQGKLKKAHNKKKDGHLANKISKSVKDDQVTDKKSKVVKDVQEIAMTNSYQISSGEEDDSKGMQKWIKEYHERRPGLKELQERIDNFITAHEEQEEQAKRERESKLAEEGWTVVVHRKGGKKTTDPESGVAVGSVAAAAVRDKLANKKSKDIGLDFYRFQRKEAHRSELMKLQSKFEEDKKRIQQLRAARKFKPY